MSDPLEIPKSAAAEMMVRSGEVAFEKLSLTVLTALERAAEALKTATTQDEITLIRDRFVAGCARLAETPYVSNR
jgi:hypothetical protein